MWKIISIIYIILASFVIAGFIPLLLWSFFGWVFISLTIFILIFIPFCIYLIGIIWSVITHKRNVKLSLVWFIPNETIIKLQKRFKKKEVKVENEKPRCDKCGIKLINHICYNDKCELYRIKVLYST